jgi:two-component SAPR family response regulator
VYILENHSFKIQNMLLWLAEKSNVEEISLIKNETLFLELAEREPPDIAFIRLGDQAIPGLSIGNKLNQMAKNTDIVYISDDGDQALNAYDVGAVGYLIGPVERNKFEKCFSNFKNK